MVLIILNYQNHLLEWTHASSFWLENGFRRERIKWALLLGVWYRDWSQGNLTRLHKKPYGLQLAIIAAVAHTTQHYCLVNP